MAEALKHILYKYPGKEQKDLIPILQDIQNENGYLSETHIQNLSKYLKIPEVKIYSIATFYNQFRFAPNAKYHIRICSGSACHVMGSDKLTETIKNTLEIQGNNRSKNGKISIEEIPCLGACALAPLIEINGIFHAKLNSQKLNRIINELLENQQ